MRRGLTVAYGQRDFEDGGEYPGVKDPSMIGFEFDTYELRGDIGWEASVQHAREDHSLQPSGRIEVETNEVSAGLRRTWRPYEVGAPWLYPYLGGGASLLYTELKDDSPGSHDKDDFDVGVYVHFGIYVEFFERFRWGVDYRFMREDFLDGSSLDVDYDQATVTLGWSF